MASQESKKYLNLLKTSFPMKANLREKEPKFIKHWDEINLYQRIQEKNKNGQTRILHDGPPYANGHIHIGHALNKTLKDFIVKYYSLKGFHSPYVPGWDCHGLPIELKVKKEGAIENLVIFRKKCRSYALKHIDIQKKEFKKLECLGDWDNPYMTMDYNYEADILDAFNKIYEKGFIYKGKKPIHWCPSCETALADAEVEYEDHSSPSIYVKFKILDKKDLFIVIWTTTPWTIPANLAVSVHPNFDYNFVKSNKGILILAKDLMENALKEMDIENYEVIKTVKGIELENLKYEHPFFNKHCPIILGDHVTLEQGTGCVHTAPGHGADDYEVGKKYNLDIFSPVDDKGRYTDDFPELKGEFVFDVNEKIIEKLRDKDLLIAQKEIKHSYPHCWRCHNPLIFRATPQWFIDTMDPKLKKNVVKNTKETKWIPKWGEVRFTNMIENRVDWCISRQRSWGVPIPSLVCEDCEEEFIDPKFTNELVHKIRENSSDIWFEKDLNELTPKELVCPKCGSKHIKKGKNILDVWFDSGVSWYAVVKNKMKEETPVDLYIEGSDQYRGWFQSSMWPATIITDKAPYKKVITHGFSLDSNGKPMSKSLGNVISPLDVIDKYGAEILRLWVASIDYTEDFKFSYNVLNQMVDSYKNIRNKLRFSLMNISDFDHSKDSVPYEEMETVDKWALNQLYLFINKLDNSFENYEFHKIYHLVSDFITVTLSSQYFDIIKSRLYTEPPKSIHRRSAQTVLYHVLSLFSQRMAPILSITMEEVYATLDGSKDSIFLEEWKKADTKWEQFDSKFFIMFEIRDLVLKEMEELRNNKTIGHSLDSKLVIRYKDEIEGIIKSFDLEEFFIVSKVEIRLDNSLETPYKIEITKAEGEKCPRCWKHSIDFSESGVCSKCQTQIDKWEG